MVQRRPQYTVRWNHVRNNWDVVDVKTGAKIRSFDNGDEAKAYCAKLNR